jgi:hypothetical protein
MMTYFEPLGEWRDVTVYPWRKSIYRPEAELTQALRVKIAKALPTPRLQDRCAHPGCWEHGFRLRYHHISPTFEEMVTECIGLTTEEERTTLFGYDKFAPGIYCMADCIPNDHPAIVRLHDLHKDNEWMWLCDAHHNQLHRAAA